jgi:hypothetical protein
MAREIGDQLGVDQTTAVIGAVRYVLGDLAGARGDLEACHPALLAVGERRIGAVAASSRGLLEQEEGRLDEAERWLTAAWREVDDLGDPLAHRYRMFLGQLALEAGRPDDARAHLAAARTGLAAAGDVRFAARALASLALCSTAEDARAHLAACRAEVAFPDKPLVLALVEAMVEPVGTAGPPVPERPWADVRFLLRLREARLAVSRELAIAADTSWFRPPGGERVGLGTRAVLRRLVEALACARRETPGRPLDAATLIRAGWAGERILPGAAQARLRVALSELRKLGLREVLERHEGGWRLDPDVPVRTG